MSNNQRDGEYAPTGEQGGTNATFSADEIGRAFGVELDRVHRAIAGEFGSGGNLVDSRQAQHLAEVLLSDLPQSNQMAALVKLGAYTPRPDHVEGLGEKDPAEESDKLKGNINDMGDDRS